MAVVTRQERTPVPLLAELAVHPNYRLRALVAESPTLSPELARQLLSDPDISVRYSAATNPKTPIELLISLADEEEELLRRAVASHANVPDALLRKLTTDNEHTVRGAVARNPRVPEDILLQLASDSYIYGYVREGVGENPRTPVMILCKLASDSETGVRCAVAKNVHTPNTLLEQLALDDEPRVRWSVAENPTVSETILRQLASDAHFTVRIAVARNPKASAVTLSQLLHDYDEAVQWWVARNPAVSEEALLQMLSDLKKPSLSSYSQKEPVLRSICWHPCLTHKVLEELKANAYEVIGLIAKKRLELGLAADRNQHQEAAAGDGMDQHIASLNVYHMLLAWEELIDPATHSQTGHFKHLLDKVSKKAPAFLSARFLGRWMQPPWHERNEKEQRGRELLSALLPYWELLPYWQNILADSSYWELRYWLALKPETSLSVLAKLTRDGHHFVQSAAHYWLRHRAEEG
ncbi:HEAT repeat domain-containing protein [Ktedonospora formicarum]|uniref:HEAT repeat domain-containing protein n=1 Tax=Ktedonospora formicarum TaxID=2778364 RepID=UPI001F42466C|nr:HEAT repeat domain-containing protein [Ktedonospora formicarum]